ncbi:hypothetical protein [Tatumella sp. JGM118]|nr:hypothetical protein [Tatumella sp. JGM118]MBS0910417.1 hypothetical protein [Tatumella sp. JGM118]
MHTNDNIRRVLSIGVRTTCGYLQIVTGQPGSSFHTAHATLTRPDTVH